MADTPAPTELAALYRIASLATRAASALAAQDEVLASIFAAFPADSGSLSLINPDNGRLEICIQQGLPPDVGEFALRPGQGITGWVALHGRPMLVTDVTLEPRYIAARQGVRSEMAAPLIVEGQTVGVVNLDADHATFTTEDLARLTRLATEAGAVLHRLWQVERLRTNSTRLTTLVELGHALVGELATEELLSTLTESGRVLLSADLCLLHDFDRSTDHLHLKAWSASGNRSQAIFAEQSPSVAATDSLLVSVIYSGRPMEFQHIDGPGYREAADLPRNAGLASALGTPLHLEGNPAGVLSVFHATPHRYNDDEKRLLAALASFAAVSLQNARLYSRVFQSEDTLRKNETLTTLGMLAAEIAHEIRNPLTVIKLLHGSLGIDLPDHDPRRRDIQVITEKIEQLEAIVSRVLSFGRTPQTLHSHWTVAEIIDDTLVLLRAKLSQANVDIHYTAPDRDLVVDVHKGQVQQVILNLALNSLHAMPHGGELTVQCAPGQADGIKVIHIDITDTGGGIPAEIQPRIFESFLSGRADGTGLGLAIAKRIVKDHHGELTLVSSSPRGTTMRITLPLIGT